MEEKTKGLLVEALMDLTAEGGWETVTVSTLCRRAEVHRSTFYAHFEDKEDLFSRSLPWFFDSLAVAGADPQTAGSPFQGLFRHCDHRRLFYRKALENGRFRSLFCQYLIHHAQGALGESGPAPIAVWFGAGAILGVVEGFVNTSFPGTPDEIAAQLAEMLHKAIPGQAEGDAPC